MNRAPATAKLNLALVVGQAGAVEMRSLGPYIASVARSLRRTEDEILGLS